MSLRTPMGGGWRVWDRIKGKRGTAYTLAPWISLFLLLPAPFSLTIHGASGNFSTIRATLRASGPLAGKEFEELVGEAYRRQGYTVRENAGPGSDGGIDLVLTENGNTYLVQCKQWRSWKVGVKVVREMYGLLTSKDASGAI